MNKMASEQMEVSDITLENKRDEAEQKTRDQFSTELIDTGPEFDKMEEEWHNLLKHSNATVFQNFSWLNSWWKYYGKDQKLTIGVFRKGDELIGIAPLYKDVQSLFGIPVSQTLRFIGSNVPTGHKQGLFTNYSTSDFLDVIVHPDYEHEVAELFIPWLERIPGGFHRMILQETTQQSWVQRILMPALRARKLKFSVSDSDVCPVIKFEEGEPERVVRRFLKQKNSRRKLQKKMETDPNYRIRTLDTEEEVNRHFDILVDMYQKRWNKIGYPGTFYDSHHYDFMREVISRLYKQGKIRFIIVETVEGEVISLDIHLLHEKSAYVYLGTFDTSSAHKKFSPGHVAQLFSVIQAIHDGYEQMHLLRGDEKYKYDLTREEIQNRVLTVSSPAGYSVFRAALLGGSDAWIALRNRWLLEKMVIAVHLRQYGYTGFALKYGANFFRRLAERVRPS